MNEPRVTFESLEHRYNDFCSYIKDVMAVAEYKEVFGTIEE